MESSGGKLDCRLRICLPVIESCNEIHSARSCQPIEYSLGNSTWRADPWDSFTWKRFLKRLAEKKWMTQYQYMQGGLSSHLSVIEENCFVVYKNNVVLSLRKVRSLKQGVFVVSSLDNVLAGHDMHKLNIEWQSQDVFGLRTMVWVPFRDRMSFSCVSFLRLMIAHEKTH